MDQPLGVGGVKRFGATERKIPKQNPTHFCGHTHPSINRQYVGHGKNLGRRKQVTSVSQLLGHVDSGLILGKPPNLRDVS